MRVLLIEDCPDDEVRSLAALQATEMPLNVTVAHNSGDAKKSLEESGPWDIVLVDFRLPGSIDGVTLAELAMELYPDARVAMLTGLPEAASRALKDNRILVFGKDIFLRGHVAALVHDASIQPGTLYAVG